jgi:hypothetical protein
MTSAVEAASAERPGRVRIPTVRGKLLRAAIGSLVLGGAIEALSFVSAAALGAPPTAAAVVANLVQKLTWSVVVCLGLSLGAVAAAGRPVAAGWAGFVAAPIGFIVARAVFQSVSHALALEAPSSVVSPFVMAGLKALEYGFLGVALGSVARRWGGGMAAHAGAGLAAGLVFGGLALVLLHPGSPAAFLSRAIQEVLFPVGCALTLFATDVFGAGRATGEPT